MRTSAMFARASARQAMYESFYVRAVSPSAPVGVWIRHTAQKRAGASATGAIWCTVFDASRGRPFTCKRTSTLLREPAGAWIEIGEQAGAERPGGSWLGPTGTLGACGEASWSLDVQPRAEPLAHLRRGWMYRARLPRTKLTSPAPDASFDGSVRVGERELQVAGWRGMVGHNWGSEHAERWIWLHGVGFAEDEAAWLDVALGRVIVAGRLTPWIANGAISLGGRRLRVGGLSGRGVRVAESVERCELQLAGEEGLTLRAQVTAPASTAACWRYDDAGGAGHDVVNCSIARVELTLAFGRGRAQTLTSAYGGAYELGMRERDHGVPLASPALVGG
jgi:hypothetical protein